MENITLPTIPTTVPPASKRPKIILISIIAFLIVTLGGGGIWFLSQSKGETASPLASAKKAVGEQLEKVTGSKNCDQTHPKIDYQKGSSPYTLLDWPNNKVGVYSYADGDSLKLAGKMVNGNGGDWGWVTIPYNINQATVGGNEEAYWNSVFEILCSEHLIPILQLFNESKPPTSAQTTKMAEFLSKLKWPTKLKFISAYNEVNASEYWGGKIDPEGYARTLGLTITELKKRDQDFFVMNGAFNSSARTNPGFKTDLGVFTAYLNLPDYLERMDKAVPGIFKKLDGWASHTYPHPGYKGKPLDARVSGESDYEAGRNTMRSYQYDLRVLKDKFGVKLPVFITETGWPHREGTASHNEWLPASTVAGYYQTVFEELYLGDPDVIAVTPFLMKMAGFDNFAFVDSKNRAYAQYDVIKNLKKTKGQPELD